MSNISRVTCSKAPKISQNVSLCNIYWILFSVLSIFAFIGIKYISKVFWNSKKSPEILCVGVARVLVFIFTWNFTNMWISLSRIKILVQKLMFAYIGFQIGAHTSFKGFLDFAWAYDSLWKYFTAYMKGNFFF